MSDEMPDETGSSTSIPQDAGTGGVADELDRFEEAEQAGAAGPAGLDTDLDADVDLDLEAPEADTAEQHIELLQHRNEPITARPPDQADEADAVDAAEQRRAVPLDEDDYR